MIYTQNSIEIIENVKSHRNDKEIDTSEWKEYNVKDIFDVSGVKSIKEKPSYISKYKTSKYNIALIGETDENNQIKGYIDSNIFDVGNVLTCNRFSGKCFYQPDVIVIQGTSSAKITIKNRILNENIGLFLINCLNRNISDVSRSNKRCKQDLLNESISLPSIIHEDGIYEPDWDFMENYIKCLKMDKEKINNYDEYFLIEKIKDYDDITSYIKSESPDFIVKSKDYEETGMECVKCPTMDDNNDVKNSEFSNYKENKGKIKLNHQCSINIRNCASCSYNKGCRKTLCYTPDNGKTHFTVAPVKHLIEQVEKKVNKKYNNAKIFKYFI